MPLPGNLLTTAMAVMPHTDIDQALKLALSLDIPFWPQLPLYNYYEDMYVQAAEHFPGIILDLEKHTLRFSTEKFINELEETLNHFDEPDYFDVSKQYSAVYNKFLSLDLAGYPAIRGQLEGPVSFGFFVKDENDRPILFNDTVRPFLFEFMSKRVNVQLNRLQQKNPNAFMFIDEPGLQFLFSALSGYSDVLAREDIDNLFAMIERPRGIHLCGNPDWDFLLGFDMDIVSIDLYTNAKVLPLYTNAIINFLKRGGLIVWGIVPTNIEPFKKETLASLVNLLESTWQGLYDQGLDREFLLSRSLISPATCCLVNPDKEKTVEKAFMLTRELSDHLRTAYKLS
ncbi:MAG: hypothetical protein JXO49_00875 [Deltaproteobacteria bacterium]|nr:hypothetical protein [Candidatus Anaeroferrophillus wilburensis]MBN2887879.1 hypothetical protein [Deltaproteobacteria bacterium]